MAHISMARTEEILQRIARLNVAVLGDLCVDIYWHADMRLSELSRETPHFPLPVVEERISLGAGGNVVANVCALGPKNVTVIGVTGRDWRGDLVRRQLDALGADAQHLIESPDRVTFAYCKPIRKGMSRLAYEDPRLDFINRRPIGAQEEERIVEALRDVRDRADVLLVSDQFEFGCVTEPVREAVCALGRDGVCVVTDSRSRIGLFHDVILKPNEMEGLRALGMEEADMRLDDYFGVAMRLAQKCASRVIMTLGDRGSVYADGRESVYSAPWAADGEIDIVGAGDTFLSGFSCALAVGAAFPEAADFASLCSSVTIAKIGITGTAAPEEITEAHRRLTAKEGLEVS
jgi:rfaE bifunctional protein kinase chain/domain